MTAPTRYPIVRGTQGIVVAGHPAAATAGARMLQRGGNAIDAAIAATAAVGVVRPHMAGIAGDGFLLVRDARTRAVHALNAGGHAPAAATLDLFPDGIPDRGPRICTVPGIVDGWGRALERFGTLGLAEVLAPAIELAERGFVVYEGFERWMRHYETKYGADPECARVLMPHGRPPRTGEVLRQPDLARSLSMLAKGGPRELYEGELASIYVKRLAKLGGVTTAADLAGYRATWGDPVTGRFRGHVVHSQPPMSQGWMLVQMLQALDAVEPGRLAMESPDRAATLATVIRAAFEDRQRSFGHPSFSLDAVLSDGRVAEIRRALGGPPRGSRHTGDTTSLSAVDAQGNAVSLIQSLWVDAGVMLPGTGIILNARLNSFSARRGDPNALAGGKMPVYTMHTYMVTRDGELAVVGGTPGGNSQVQTNLQVLTNIIDGGMTAQAAVEAPRLVAGGVLHYDRASASAVAMEDRFPEDARRVLAERGFELSLLPAWSSLELEGVNPVTVGSAKLIAVDPGTGARTAGVDPRREAYAALA